MLLVGRGGVVEVEALDPARDPLQELEAGIGRPARVAALHLGDLDVPRPGGVGVREGEGQRGSVATHRPNVHVDLLRGQEIKRRRSIFFFQIDARTHCAVLHFLRILQG